MNKLNFLCWLCDRTCCFLEKFTPLARTLHCRRQWREWQILSLLLAIVFFVVAVLFGLVWFVILNIEHNLDNIDGIYFFAVLFCLFFIFSIHKVLDNFFNYILIIQFWPCLYFYPPAHGSHPGSDFFVFLVLFLCFFFIFWHQLWKLPGAKVVYCDCFHFFYWECGVQSLCVRRSSISNWNWIVCLIICLLIKRFFSTNLQWVLSVHPQLVVRPEKCLHHLKICEQCYRCWIYIYMKSTTAVLNSYKMCYPNIRRLKKLYKYEQTCWTFWKLLLLWWACSKDLEDQSRPQYLACILFLVLLQLCGRSPQPLAEL